MRIEDFLAEPFTPCVRLRVGGRLDDVIEISQLYFDDHKDELLDYCRSIGARPGDNWRALKQHTGGNGTIARLLVALGDLVGAWKMHPTPGAPERMWNRESPRIFMVLETPQPRVPKPSSGHLEVDTAPCSCCHRPMGPATSTVHDLTQSGAGSMCLECDVLDCDERSGRCNVLDGISTTPSRSEPRRAEEAVDLSPPAGLMEYLKQFE